MAVHHDGALGAELETRGRSELALRHDADGEDDEGAVYALSARDVDADAVFKLLVALNGVLEAQVQALFTQVRVQLAGHIPVEGRQHLLAALQQRDFDARLHEVFGRLEADESAADDHGALRLLLLHNAAHLERVLNGTQLEYAL